MILTDLADPAKELDDAGFVILPATLPNDLLDRLRRDLPLRAEACSAMLRQRDMDTGGGNVAHHIVGGGDSVAEFLGMDIADDLIGAFLGGQFILNSYGAVNNAPAGGKGYEHGQKFHRDVRTYAGSFHLMLNMIVMVDEFTRENGGTYVVPKSHLVGDRPSEDEMLSRAIQLTGPAGSVAVFDSNLWHAAAPNLTNSPRWALTLTFTRPFMKQQMDYPRLLGEEYPRSARMRQLLGYNARVPSTMAEWYQPAPLRMYKSDQG
jgi:hypothetical protein